MSKTFRFSGSYNNISYLLKAISNFTKCLINFFNWIKKKTYTVYHNNIVHWVYLAPSFNNIKSPVLKKGMFYFFWVMSSPICFVPFLWSLSLTLRMANRISNTKQLKKKAFYRVTTLFCWLPCFTCLLYTSRCV